MFVANGFIVHNSYGVDLPAFRAIIKDLRRYGQRGLNWIPVLDYMQMSGRAGRPNYDKEGQAIAIALTKGEKEKIEERYLKGSPEDIYSKLAVEPVLRTYVLSLISSGFVTSHFFPIKFVLLIVFNVLKSASSFLEHIMTFAPSERNISAMAASEAFEQRKEDLEVTLGKFFPGILQVQKFHAHAKESFYLFFEKR